MALFVGLITRYFRPASGRIAADLEELGKEEFLRQYLDNLALRRGKRNFLVSLFLPILLILELMLKTTQFVLARCNVISPGGIMLIVRREEG